MTDSITITRSFAATRERVWAAWTRPENFSTWFGTEAVDVPLDTLSLDVRVGGVWTAVMHLPDGGTIHWHGEYTEIEPPERLAFTMCDDPSIDSDEPVTVTLEEIEGAMQFPMTRMTLAQPRGDFTDEQVEQTVAGYNGFFDAMEKLLGGSRRGQ